MMWWCSMWSWFFHRYLKMLSQVTVTCHLRCYFKVIVTKTVEQPPTFPKIPNQWSKIKSPYTERDPHKCITGSCAGARAAQGRKSNLWANGPGTTSLSLEENAPVQRFLVCSLWVPKQHSFMIGSKQAPVLFHPQKPCQGNSHENSKGVELLSHKRQLKAKCT